MPSNTSRRTFLAGLAVGFTATSAGCLGSDPTTARCSGRGDHREDGPLRRIKVVRGDEQLSLGILVDEDAPTDDSIAAVTVRDRDGDLLADVPITDNRNMSDLEPDIDSALGDDGELYAVVLGPPAQHGVVDVAVIDSDDEIVQSVSYEYNCYRPDDGLP
ncbi:hypothetical protein [Natrarchaeobaculum sulfurireducens]|uniref:Uncharacterized protein n=1 Tax=Natrarchaeobaculum sulfurireducens TaxID=2044521 RepID=A0A346PEZ7_9EURY|nr:hypothetical protein [Natrarchaeobaculum sulfurireducens]AXR78092.1 hypothetical protein AArc1_1768 [Natrarchaeobaculum sulfurireducens]